MVRSRIIKSVGVGLVVAVASVAVAIGLYNHLRTTATTASSAGNPGRGDTAALLPESHAELAPAAHPTSNKPALFTEVSSELGLPGMDQVWPDGTYALYEIMGGGVGLFDYDGDGDLDILQIRGPPPGRPKAAAPNRLFQQQADGTFRDVTAASGLADPGYGQGLAVGDVDNDGDPDVYVTNYGADAFYLNQGDGTFTNATEAAGFSGDRWSMGAAFLDYDRDGDLDLFVVHYVKLHTTAPCPDDHAAPEYCSPDNYEAAGDTLYRNNGDGTFTDVTAQAGIDATGPGLGVVCADLTGDGWVDVFVANDGAANHLWVNRRDSTFAEEAVVRGAALNDNGFAEAGMGAIVADVDGHGGLDLFITTFSGETNTLYLSQEAGLFADASAASGLSAVDLPFTGMGCGFLDLDHDGDLDLAIACGRVVRGPVLPGANRSRFWNPYLEPNLLFRNDGRGHFSDVSALAGTFTSLVELNVGLALGDIDGDGDVDLVTTSVGGPLRVFRNDAPPPGNHWLQLRVVTASRPAIGAEVTVAAGSGNHRGVVLRSYGYLSSHDPRIHVGLGKIDTVDAIEVRWPDGTRERFKAAGVDRQLTVRQGDGQSL